MINIRQERPEDEYTVEELTRDAFWEKFWGEGQVICDEHLLVHRLRKCAAFVPELSLVAEIDGKLVGHIIYSKSKVVSESGAEHEMLTFGPLSVRPDFQNRGIGKALMRRSFELAREIGYRAVIIFGHPDYYTRVGFRRAGEFGISTSDGQNFDPFMAYPLFDGALDGISGRYYHDEVYDNLSDEDVREFDKKFPPKARYVPVSIEALLNRLEPPARAAIAGLNCGLLNDMKTKSEREIAALEGIDATALQTIRDVMAEHGAEWGIAR